MESSEPASSAETSPGQLLQNAREALGISRREMAARLNWMPTYIDAVEENRFEVLRGDAFVRGYLRAYAKLVKVPEDTLMAAYAALPDSEPQSGEASKRVESRIPQVQKKGIAIPAGAALLALLVFFLWYWRAGEHEGAGTSAALVTDNNEIDAPQQAEALVQEKSVSLLVLPEAAGARPAAATVSPAPDAQAVEGSAAAVGASGDPAPMRAAETAELSVASDESADMPVESSADVTDSGSSVLAAGPKIITVDSAVSADTADRSQLQFRFSGDCWVEVRDAGAELIYADLRREGEVLNLSGLGPFSILLGNARAVKLDYQGQEVAIERRPGRSVAQFMVGEQ